MKKRKWILLCFLVFATTCVQGVEIQRVILSTNDHPDYIQFWPIVAKAWKNLGFRPTLALIGDPDLVVDESLGDVLRFPPLTGIPTSFHAQVIRLLLPAYFPNDFCLVSDIDILPLDKNYFAGGVKNVSEEAFVVYRDKAFDRATPQFPMCYIAAKGVTFMSVFQIERPSDIPSIIQKWHQLQLGWCTDQLLLHKYLTSWTHFDKRCVKLGHKVKRRIDRGKWKKYGDFTLLKRKNYIDAHLPRPYEKYQSSIDTLLSLQTL